jgi:hypothetical protein
VNTALRKFGSALVFQVAIVVFLIWLGFLSLALLPLGLILAGGLVALSYFIWPPEAVR